MSDQFIKDKYFMTLGSKLAFEKGEYQLEQ